MTNCTKEPENDAVKPKNGAIDLISRRDAIDALKEHRALYCNNIPDTFSKLSYAEKSRVDELDMAIATLINLPSAQPKTGEWVEQSGMTRGAKMTKEDIYKVVYRVLSEVYELEGANSVDHTLGQIMGIMNLALEIENVVLAEAPKKPEHDGCTNCKHSKTAEWEEPCKECKQSYTDKWEGAF